MDSAKAREIEAIHPSLWRGTQLARYAGRTVDTGYDELSAELPGNGWPTGCLIECLGQKTGIGELRTFAPALTKLGGRPIMFVAPTAQPSIAGLAHIGLPVDWLMLLTPKSSTDALWSAEQILRSGTCGAMLFWQSHIRQESLRRLQLAAKSGDTLFVVFRPLATAVDPSPAELRIALRPADVGAEGEIVKRKGPACDRRIRIALRPSAVLLSPHGRSRRSVTTTVTAGDEPAFV